MVLRRENLDQEDRYVKMKANRNGKCHECGIHLIEGDSIVWDTKERKAYCAECGENL